MPCAAIRIGLGVGRLGQRAMHLLAFGHGRRPVRRRAHQRMAEAHPGAERDQLRRLGRRDGVGPDPEPLGRAPQQRDVADRLGRRGEQQPLGLGRERFEAPQEALLDAAGQRPERREGRIRPPARRASGRGAAPSARADCRASRRRSGRGSARRAPRAARRRAARARRRPRSLGRPAPAARRARPRGWARGRRTPSRSAPRAGAARRTRAPARTRDRAIAHRRRGTPAAAPRPPRPAGSAPPGRPRSDPGWPPSCSPKATRSASRCGPGSPSRPPSIGAHS